MLLKVNEVSLKDPPLNEWVMVIEMEEAGLVGMYWAMARASKPNPTELDNTQLKHDMVWELEERTYQPMNISDLWLDPKNAFAVEDSDE